MNLSGKTGNIVVAQELIDDYIYFYNHERIQLNTKLNTYEKKCQLG
jgi:hypothetical protein